VTSLEVSVIVCTRNRAAQLERMLGTASSLDLPPGTRWELIVVDNGSTDATRQVTNRLSGRLPLRRIAEPAAGVCNARNRGIDEALGDYICWADDDVLLDPAWLRAYLDAFRRHPEAAYFGGPIRPMLEAPSPPAFRRCIDCWPLTGVFAERDFGEVEVLLSVADGLIPWGANLAVRAVEQRKHRFNAALGPSPAFDRLGDESDVLHRLAKEGATGWWVPLAGVRHVIHRERQTLRYLVSYYRRSGETAAYLHDHWPGDNALEAQGPLPFVAASTARLRLRLVAHCLRAIAARLAGRTCSWLGHLANHGYDMGVIAYRRASARADRLQ